MISTLCMELHAFEYMRFHLAVSGEVQDIGQLPGCVTEAELTMGERLFIRNSQFLDKIPENSSVGEDVLFKPFSVAIRQCLELREPERMLEVVERLHMDALACKMNGAQMLRLVREAYRLSFCPAYFRMSTILMSGKSGKSSFADRLNCAAAMRGCLIFWLTPCGSHQSGRGKL